MMYTATLCGIAAGGALGACSRFVLSNFCYARFGTHFPWGTLCVNIVGSILAGGLVGASMGGEMLAPVWTDALAKGYLGALTTFSTFTLDTLACFRQGKPARGLANIVLNLGACLAGTATGYTTGYLLTS